ncbi:MAG: alcohol dehydrogenase catalytic domain-containing protein [Actinomycetota bacterium]
MRIRSVGICGTDQKIFHGAIPVGYPRVMGHELSGEVAVAPPGSGVSVGSRVLVDPGITCGTCRQCREGRGNICTRGWLIGRDRDGGLREVLDVPATNLHTLPPSLDHDVAPLLQVLATCVHAQQRSPVAAGESVVIVGLGVTGLLHLQLAKHRGASPVVCVTRNEAKLELARRLGADVTVRAGESGGSDRVAGATGGGADLVIECAGTVATLASAIEVARIGGRILSYGTISEVEGALPFYDLYYKELAITNARSALAADFPAAITAVAERHVQLAPLVSHRFELDEVEEAIRVGGEGGSLKVLIEV